MAQVRIKVVCTDGSVRRFTPSPEFTLAELITTSGGQYHVYNDDEGDEITIKSQEDLCEALSQAAPTGMLKIHARSDEAPSKWPKLSTDTKDIKAHYPVLIVGSGYGGGVSACRLSGLGQKVCVLERGKEMWPGEYPDTFAKAAPEMQIRTPILPGLLPQVGPKDGFLDFRIEQGVIVWIGCGLGGGSLVNSGVCIAPDTRVFDDPKWPAGLRTDKTTRLADGFKKAHAMLQPEKYPYQATAPIDRATRMEEAAAELRKQGYAQAKADLADVNVSFKDKVSAGGVAQPACTLCGDCNTGCNIGAKNTVLMNYLPAAHATGNTEIFCQVEVLYVEQLQQPTARQTAQGSSSKGTGEQVWNVVCASTAPADKGRQFAVTTDVLILAAGTLGSTEILLRSKERGMSMSGEVGLHFGTDGDFFSIGYNAEAPWAGLGFGAGPDSEKRQAKEGNSGPCITSVLDMRDPSTPAAKGMIVEDMAIPSAFVDALSVLFATIADTTGDATDPSIAAKAAAAARQAKDVVAGPWAKDGAMSNSIMYGVMAFDDQAGHMALEEDVLRIRWPGHPTASGPDPTSTNAMLRDVSAMPGNKSTYVKNPFVPYGERATVHPFGGCTMGDDSSTGGCNHKGQVFSQSDAASTDVYSNLYVCDGSTIPTSLGVNPLWTISAVAERAVQLLAEERFGAAPLVVNDSDQHLNQQQFSMPVAATSTSAPPPVYPYTTHGASAKTQW